MMNLNTPGVDSKRKKESREGKESEWPYRFKMCQRAAGNVTLGKWTLYMCAGKDKAEKSKH